MVLLWGLPADPPMRAVRQALQNLGCSSFFLDQQAVLDTESEFTAGATLSGSLRVGG